MTLQQKANNKKCRICSQYIDSINQKFVYVKSRNKRENFYHLECISKERRQNGNSNNKQ